jgi:hypothetical protein
MSQHRFVRGDAVVVHADPLVSGVRPGLYFVQEQLPARNGEPQYRIKSALDPQECIVEEGWIRLADKW